MTQTKSMRAERERARAGRAGAGLQWTALALAVASAGMVPNVSAQDSGRHMVELEEVLVTARRREESLQDVPIAITAMSADFLRQQNITELADLATHVPAMGVSTGGTSTNVPIVVLRGQRPSEVTMTVDPAVPLYFAEVVLTPTQGTNLAMYDLSNVQVLKGPQGTLFGRNSTGGAMLLTPQRPGEELGGYAEAKIGDYNLYHFEGAVDLPASDTLKFRLAGRSVDRDGYQSNVADNALRGDDKFWDENSYGLRLTARFTPNDRLSNLTTIAYDENEMLARVSAPQAFNSSAGLGQLFDVVHNGRLNGLFGTPVGKNVDAALERQRGRDWTEIETDVDATEEIENWFAANTTEFELTDDLRIKNVFGYRDLDYVFSSDVDGTALPMIGARTSITEPVTLNPPLGNIEAEQFSDELQLLGSAFDDKLEWIVGAYWMSMEGSQTFPQQNLGANPAWPTGPSPIPQLALPWLAAQSGWYQDSPAGDVENEAYALFGEGTYTLNEQWSLTLGARQSWDQRTLKATNFALDTTTLRYGCAMRDENGVLLPDNACEREVDEDFDRATWRTALNYSPTEDMLIYGSIATGYRTGGFNGRGTNNFTLQPFEEETVINYELGHKTDWQLGEIASMRTNLAIYLQQYDDIQKTVSGNNPDTGAFETFTTNAAEAEIQGVDFDVLIAPTESLQISVAYAYVDAEYKEWDRAIAPGVVIDYTESPFVYIAEHSLTTSLQYTLPLDASVGEVSLMGSVYWQDDTEASADAWRWDTLGWSQANLDEALASTVIDDYAIWNFRVDWLGVMGSSFDLAAFVNNAADEEYVTGGLNVPDSLGWAAANYGPPRTYGASVRYSF
ncbi:MAG: TonB-dependent receptor [Pseudomonadales bacterium]|jgi:iron complex outermembrane receptor protein|nr:TonB-dependent receptor [Pseudomonadales bacterium]MBP7911035.1 TonB-dependent receptor [Pseudomonadales bacterium]